MYEIAPCSPTAALADRDTAVGTAAPRRVWQRFDTEGRGLTARASTGSNYLPLPTASGATTSWTAYVGDLHQMCKNRIFFMGFLCAIARNWAAAAAAAAAARDAKSTEGSAAEGGAAERGAAGGGSAGLAPPADTRTSAAPHALGSAAAVACGVALWPRRSASPCFARRCRGSGPSCTDPAGVARRVLRRTSDVFVKS